MHAQLRRKIVASAICAFSAVTSLPAGAQPRTEADRLSKRGNEEISMAERAFGIDLLRAITAGKGHDNVFISPVSVFLALQMVGDGAAGATRAAILKTLELRDRDRATSDTSTRTMQNKLASERGIKLTIADALWADRHFMLAPDFVKRCASVFDARAASLDFGSPSAAREINHWVSEKTNGKISDIVTQDGVAGSKMVLTNAVYFSGRWEAPFESSATERAPFHKQSGGIKTVSMMYKSRLSGAYRSGSTFEGAMLYYGASGIYFYALLPRPGKTPNDVLASLDPPRLTKDSQGIDLELKLPRFTLDYSSSLGSNLAKMGMAIAFRFPDADFSPMGSRKFVIGDVIHKTRLEVDEGGTIAAAATAIGMRAGAARGHREVTPPLRTVVFNRPFVVLIGDSSTGALLFAGVIEEP